MALTATIYNFDIDLADHDRGVYESLALRVLAYALEYTEGLAFTTGLSTPDEPALWVKDLTGRVRTWIDVGTPDADRLHRAAKAAPRVVVYVHRDPTQFMARLAGERIHRAADIEIWAVDRTLLAGLAARLDRRMTFALSVAEGELFVSIGAETLSGRVSRQILETP